MQFFKTNWFTASSKFIGKISRIHAFGY